ncbi:unnamed protein product [Durusdinium trenchii]|uniref:Uncharacterized protein n=2 Tax=Durusdinium trenchii TaxID=1381693 RepID=A0ABP0I3M2_9DINO
MLFLLIGTEDLDVFGGPGGIIYGIAVCIVIASWGLVNEALFNIGEEYEKDRCKKDNLKCPFIFSLKKLPATQTKLALEGMTFQQLKPYKDDRMMLYKNILSSGLPAADCLDVMSALEKYVKNEL